MATIRVRDIPEETYQVIWRRARAEGKSIQAYLRDQVIAMAARPTKREALAAIESALEEYGPVSFAPEDIVRDLHVDRR
jgi:plasmid stability protein